MGEFGYAIVAASEVGVGSDFTAAENVTAFKKVFMKSPNAGYLKDCCVCTYEDIPALCNQVSTVAFRQGGSWWVPPLSGGKGLGDAWLTTWFDYKNKQGTYTYFETWGVDTLKWLTSIDSNQDG